ncbi:hypothetical protein ABBQ38_000958 [Trebouxia sp. C0009 RCD-2024]
MQDRPTGGFYKTAPAFNWDATAGLMSAVRLWCHWGPCPPCGHFCGTPHPCGHACSSPGCHDAQPPPIPAFTPPLPPSSASFIATKPVQGDAAEGDMPSAAVQVAAAAVVQQQRLVKSVAGGVSASRAVAAEAERAKLLCCHKPCHKALPKCPHVCQATCHPGACPAASGGACLEEVSVRCHCRSRRAKLPCQEVQQMLRASEGVESYTDTTPLRLLPCDGACQKAKSKQEAEPTTRSTASTLFSMQPGHISSAQPSPPVSSVTESAKGPRRRNRAERAALQQEQEVLEQQEAKRSFRWSMLWRTLLATLAAGFAYTAFVTFYDMI